jgi:hypothetical protein
LQSLRISSRVVYIREHVDVEELSFHRLVNALGRVSQTPEKFCVLSEALSTHCGFAEGAGKTNPQGFYGARDR